MQAQTPKTTAYRLFIEQVDKDSSFSLQPLKLQTEFTSKKSLYWSYIRGLPALLGSKGYPTASVDSTERK